VNYFDKLRATNRRRKNKDGRYRETGLMAAQREEHLRTPWDIDTPWHVWGAADKAAWQALAAVGAAMGQWVRYVAADRETGADTEDTES